MKRVRQTINPTDQSAPEQARAVPLMVPHGGGDSGRDFESAFDLLQGDQQPRELWHRARVRKPLESAS